MSFVGNRQQVESYKTEAVPQSLQGNDSPASMKGRVTQVVVQSTNGDQRGLGKLRFVLPNNNVSISRRSMFIRARCSLIYTATVPGFFSNLTNCVWFQGPGPTNIGGSANWSNVSQASAFNANATFGAPQCSNAYSLIQKSTLYSGSAVVDMIDYVCDLMSGLILPHCTNTNWIQSDGSTLLAINSGPVRIFNGSFSSNLGGTVYWDLCIPVPHSCFNSENDFPTYLLSDSNPLSLEIDLTSFNRAISYGSTAVPSVLDYTISRAALCYEAVELPSEFIEAQRLATKKIPFVIPQLSYMINQMPTSALVNYNAILKMSSLRAVYILPSNMAVYNAAYAASQAGAFAYQRNAGDFAPVIANQYGDNSGTNAQLFIDGRCINQVNLDNPIMTFVALKQALKGSITDYTSSSICNRFTYGASYFAIGIDTTCFSDQSTLMGGTPVNEAQVVLTNFIASATTGAYLANIIFAYDSLIIIKNGKITTKR